MEGGPVVKEADVEHLMSVAIATARVLGFGIAENCQDHLRAALKNADLTALPISAAPPPSVPIDPAVRLYLAATRVAMYVAAMAGDALTTGVPADGLLHENNFFAVKQWICPLWPVC